MPFFQLSPILDPPSVFFCSPLPCEKTKTQITVRSLPIHERNNSIPWLNPPMKLGGMSWSCFCKSAQSIDVNDSLSSERFQVSNLGFRPTNTLVSNVIISVTSPTQLQICCLCLSTTQVYQRTSQPQALSAVNPRMEGERPDQLIE